MRPSDLFVLAGGRTTRHACITGPPPLPTAPTLPSFADFLLINWCSVQRIMRRCNVLAPERIAMLDELGFDWSGADPLS